MMRREKLQALKNAARKMDHHPSTQTEHALIDHGLEALDLIEGGTTLANQYKEVKAGLAELRVQLSTILDNIPADLEPAVVDGEPLIRDLSKAIYVTDLVAGMLTTDYRRYPSWADVRQQMEEEFA